MSDQANPGSDGTLGELPLVGSHARRTNVHTPDASGTTLTIEEAAERFGVSTTTLRRRLKRGEIPGAHKRPGPKGDEWRIPVAAMTAAGYEGSAPVPATPSLELGELLTTINRLANLIETGQRGLMAAAEDRARLEVEAARLTGQLEAERRRREDAEAALAEARERLAERRPEEAPPPAETSRRRWWHRG